ncbi:MBOAT family protein [Methylophilaceae bacterium]|nr:MBOAT family protein [Methylophilaceae bacterium]
MDSALIFSSYIYIVFFLPIVFIGYFALSRIKNKDFQLLWLLAASLFFYSWWDIKYLPILLISIFINFQIGKLLSKLFTKKKPILFIGITFNLLLLLYFKHFDFFIENYNGLFSQKISSLNLIIPLGISFFTFQQIAFLVDVYTNKTSDYKFLHYATYVSFFPQLIAGPIVHHKDLMPQFDDLSKRNINLRNISLGLFIFSIGLFKKVVIADSLGGFVTSGYSSTLLISTIEAWALSLSYTFQLYFDFSGYADMAIGSALLVNIRLPINFNSPYKAKNIQEFWRRWHMTLSHFLRDYIYIPLGGNRLSYFITYKNILFTFILGGIWHGAGWTFIFWGGLHGFALIILSLWRKIGWKIPMVLSWFITFNFVNIAWVFFRADNFNAAINIIGAMFGITQKSIPLDYIDSMSILIGIPLLPYVPNFSTNAIFPSYLFLYLLILMLFVLFASNINKAYQSPNQASTISYTKLILGVLAFSISIIFLGMSSSQVFLYYNF